MRTPFAWMAEHWGPEHAAEGEVSAATERAAAALREDKETLEALKRTIFRGTFMGQPDKEDKDEYYINYKGYYVGEIPSCMRERDVNWAHLALMLAPELGQAQVDKQSLLPDLFDWVEWSDSEDDGAADPDDDESGLVTATTTTSDGPVLSATSDVSG